MMRPHKSKHWLPGSPKVTGGISLSMLPPGTGHEWLARPRQQGTATADQQGLYSEQGACGHSVSPVCGKGLRRHDTLMESQASTFKQLCQICSSRTAHAGHLFTPLAIGLHVCSSVRERAGLITCRHGLTRLPAPAAECARKRGVEKAAEGAHLPPLLGDFVRGQRLVGQHAPAALFGHGTADLCRRCGCPWRRRFEGDPDFLMLVWHLPGHARTHFVALECMMC
jgi:hypothetical protein